MIVDEIIAALRAIRDRARPGGAEESMRHDRAAAPSDPITVEVALGERAMTS